MNVVTSLEFYNLPKLLKLATTWKTTYTMKILLTILMAISSVIIYGQTDTIYQIDIELQECLDSDENYTTKGMVECINSATEKWDNALNQKYRQLLELLSEEQKEKLKIAQKKWIEYRDKEIDFSNQLYREMQGTMWIPVAAQTKLELTRKRTIELEAHISNLTID